MPVKLTFEGIRCFVTKQEAVLRPLTLLVGENSSGKSTFLALCRIARSIVDGADSLVPFNEPPFLLGAYDQIASYKAGRRAKSFSVGLESYDASKERKTLQASFAPRNGQPSVEEWRVGSGSTQMRIVDRPPVGRTLYCEGSRGQVETPFADSPFSFGILWLPVDVERSLRKVLTEPEQASLRAISRSFLKAIGAREYAFAPIRTSAQRTYDPIGVEPNPTGSHIPMLLAGLAASSSPGEWKALKEELREFGVESGLFDQIEVIRKGRKESDPFQIGVKSGGPAFNLVDVGYGVSQVLPILVDIARRANEDIMFLMQQPEVHLHPRAQAQLGTFFARRAGPKQRFVVETHSDYLIDRVRMEVRRGKFIKPEDVSILYFERYDRGAQIHNLELDTEGNIVNAPSGYRQFFLNETRSLLGI